MVMFSNCIFIDLFHLKTPICYTNKLFYTGIFIFPDIIVLESILSVIRRLLVMVDHVNMVMFLNYIFINLFHLKMPICHTNKLFYTGIFIFSDIIVLESILSVIH